jgi:SulP family sulfate permease
VTVLRLDGGLFFATADALEDRLREVALAPDGVRAVVLDFAGVSFIDAQGSAQLGEILDLIVAEGMSLRLARVKPAVRETLARDGVLARIGEDRIHGNVDEAVAAQLAGSP